MTVTGLLKLIGKTLCPVGEEPVPLIEAGGRVSAEGLRAPFSLPPVPVSALDGYAVKGKGRSFRVKGSLSPLSQASATLSPGEALFVPTGGLIPKRTRFLRRERVGEGRDGTIEVPSSGDDRRLWPSGQWLRKGDRVILRGDVLRPATIASLVMAGRTEVMVFRRPQVAVLTTGDELKTGIVPDSNRYLLAASVTRDGATLFAAETAGDDKTELRDRITAMAPADLLVVTGGTAMGRKDLCRTVFEDLGARFLFRKTGFSPGSSMAMGLLGALPFFVLPGNPRALSTLYSVFVGAGVMRLAGRLDWQGTISRFRATQALAGQRGKTLLLGVKLSFERGSVEQAGGGAVSDATAILVGARGVNSGEEVTVIWRSRTYR